MAKTPTSMLEQALELYQIVRGNMLRWLSATRQEDQELGSYVKSLYDDLRVLGWTRMTKFDSVRDFLDSELNVNVPSGSLLFIDKYTIPFISQGLDSTTKCGVWWDTNGSYLHDEIAQHRYHDGHDDCVFIGNYGGVL